MPTFQIFIPNHYNFLNYVQHALALFFLTGPIATFFYCALSFYVLYLVLGLSLPFAAVGGLATTLVTGNFIVWEAGHLPKLIVLAMTGFILAGLILSYRGKWLLGAAIFGLGIGINVLNNHVQMSYYTMILLLPLIISYAVSAIKEKKINSFVIPSAILAGVTALALLASSSTILPTYEYAKETMRGGHILKNKAGSTEGDVNQGGLQWDYAMNWSNGSTDILSCLIPGLAGGGSSEPLDASSATAKEIRKKGYQPPKRLQAPLYWGELPFTSGPFYFGSILCFLFVLGLFTVKGPLKWWIAIAVPLGMLISMGKHAEILNRFLFDYIPLYSKFRAPSSMLSVVSYFFPILGMLALYQITHREGKNEDWIKKIYYSAGITAGLCLFFALLGPELFNFSHSTDATYAKQGFDTDAMISDRKSLMRSDSFRSMMFILAAAAGLWLFVKNKMNAMTTALMLGGLILVDLGGVARRYVHTDDFVAKSKKDNTQKPRPVDQEILRDKSTYRVLDLSVNTFNSSLPSLFHKHVGGYHPAKLQRYQDLIDLHIDPEIQKLYYIMQNAVSDSTAVAAMANLNVLNMLNTKYFILGQADKETALPNPHASGNAWFVQMIKTVETPDDEIAALGNNNLKQIAIVHKEFMDRLPVTSFNGQGTIKLSSYSPNKMVYESDSPTDQFAVFSEIWYGPELGWTITIDGKPAELVRANYALRACAIPSGKHQIVMEFKPRSFHLGKNLSMICSLLMIGLMGYAAFSSWRKNNAVS